MESISKVLSIIKIPLKVLLPAVWLFSGILLFLNDKMLNKLHLYDWSQNNGFLLGLSFIITTCLIIVYAFYYVVEKVKGFINQKNENKKFLKALLSLNDKEKRILINLYKQDGYTGNINYADPLIKGLVSRSMIFMGNNAFASVGWNGEVITKGTLQPFVWRTFKWAEESIDDEISKLEKKNKKSKYNRKIKEMRELRELLRR